MKKLIIAALMLTASSATFAQFTNGGTNGGDNSDYNKVYVSFNFASVSDKISGASATVVSPVGFNAGYARGFNLKNTLPLFLEVGGEFNFLSGSKAKVSYTMMNISIPVNVTYRFDVANNFAIAPFAGLNFKVNLSATAKPDGGKSSSFFSKDDMGSSDLTANRFQLGMNLGANFIVKSKYYLGYSFQPDFIKFQSYKLLGVDCSSNVTTHHVTVGYIF